MPMSDMTITYLADAPESIPVLAQWLHDEWDHMYVGATIETRTRRLESLRNRDVVPLGIVARANAETLGIASLIHSDMETHPELTPWLASVYVGAPFRGQGIGRALVTRLTEEAKRLGFSTIYLWTDKEEHFYASMNWRLLSREEYKNKSVSVMSYSFP